MSLFRSLTLLNAVSLRKTGKNNPLLNTQKHSDLGANSVQDDSELHSGIFHGWVQHHRLDIKEHQFGYPVYMFGFDVDELPQLGKTSWLFGFSAWNMVRFREADYVKTAGSLPIKERIAKKISERGGNWDASQRVLMVAQCRCLGLYFSPINFYFCFDEQQDCQYLLAEVSNTPWNQRFYYLLETSHEQLADKANQQFTEKTFHVSPFMKMNMRYHWQVTLKNNALSVKITNCPLQQESSTLDVEQQKLFQATLTLKRQAFTAKNLKYALWKTPSMSLKILSGIYWQAFRLWRKKIPFVPYPKH